MSDEPDRERVRALIAELDEVRQEFERLRAKIAETRRQSSDIPATVIGLIQRKPPVLPPKGGRDLADYG